MGKSRSDRPGWQKEIARERIAMLLDKASREFRDNPDSARRHVQMAMKLSMRYNARMRSEQKRQFCRKCFSYLKPGVSARVRTSPGQRSVLVTCLFCGHAERHPYRRERH
jgi:ribonuclease P protein subunit RPR2